MQVTTTFRHMESSQAVRQYAVERLTKLRKYFRREPIAGHAVFSVENEHQHSAELSLTLPNGLVVQARETTEDMYSSIDLAGARIERQVRRWKDRIRDHKPHGGPSFALTDRVLAAEGLEPARAGQGGRPSRGAASARAAVKPRKTLERRVTRAGARPTAPVAPVVPIVREQTFTVRTLRVEDAVLQLNLLDSDFLVFNDAQSRSIAVVYRRKDGHYGLIDTGAQVSSTTADELSKAGGSVEP